MREPEGLCPPLPGPNHHDFHLNQAAARATASASAPLPILPQPVAWSIICGVDRSETRSIRVRPAPPPSTLLSFQEGPAANLIRSARSPCETALWPKASPSAC